VVLGQYANPLYANGSALHRQGSGTSPGQPVDGAAARRDAASPSGVPLATG
jgi:hypothetical protein